MAGTDVFPIDPDYTVEEQWTDGVLRSLSLGRVDFTRVVAPPQRIFRPQLKQRTTAEHEQVIAWYRQYEASWFRFDHKVYIVESGAYVTRSFPVLWNAAPRLELVGNDVWDIECEFIEAPGRALPSDKYPDPSAGHPTITVAGTDSGGDRVFYYGGYGYQSAYGGTVKLDGATSTASKLDVPLGLHQVVFVGGSGSGSLTAVI